VDVWAVAVGPGTFTGLRVGISTIQGLALAGGRRCVGVSALQAWALGAAGSAPAIVTLLDATRGQVYGQAFDGEAEPMGPPRLGRIEELAGQAPAGAAFVGDVVAGARRSIETARPGARFPPARPFLAARVAALALRAAADGRTEAPEALRPLYLREAALRKSVQA
jgi:tRNA threonylcarbamoyladenosine biosynthesis protein TsaB